MKILIIEDDQNLSRVIARCLHAAYDTDQAFDGTEGFFYAKEKVYDLIILDRLLPGMDGITLLKNLRDEHVDTPVLMLTALSTTSDKITGLRAGADDYLTKPFSKEELLLRIEAIIRRSLNVETTDDIRFKELVLKPLHRQAYVKGQSLDLKGRQYALLEYLVSRQGTLISKKQLFDKVWGFMSDTSSNVVEVYVSTLRRQLKPFGYDGYLKTIRGAGYLFSEDEYV